MSKNEPPISLESAELGEVNKDGAKVDEVYKDQGDDIIIVVSSDDVSFHVHRYFLQAASVVFRTMLEDCATSPPEIRLTDAKLEQSPVIRHLLNLACGKAFTGIDNIHRQDVCDLIDLCAKYDCVTPMQILRLEIISPIADDRERAISSAGRFLFACMIDELDAAHRFLPPASLAAWAVDETLPDRGPASGLGQKPSVDITSMPICWMERFPAKYLYGLIRATRLRLTHPPGTWQSVADDFKKQVRLQEPKSAAVKSEAAGPG